MWPWVISTGTAFSISPRPLSPRLRGTKTWAIAARPEAAHPTAPLVLLVLRVLFPIKPTATRAIHAKPVVTTMKLEDRRVKIAQLANTMMNLENRRVEIAQPVKFQEQVHLIVNKLAAMQKLIIQHTKRIVIQ